MTLTLMLLEADGTVHYTGLHQDIYVYRHESQQCEIVETKGMWLGVVDNIDGINQVQTFTLQAGDAMLLYTDGIVEAKDADDQLYSNRKLQAVFEKNGHCTTDAIRDAIIDSLEGYEWDDDITLMVVQKSLDSR